MSPCALSRCRPFTRDVVKAMQMRIDALEDELRQMQVTQSGSAATRPTSNPASRKNDSLPLQGKPPSRSFGHEYPYS